MNILVREPTRITYHAATCLDNICTNIEGGSVRVVQPHFILSYAITTMKKKEVLVKTIQLF